MRLFLTIAVLLVGKRKPVPCTERAPLRGKFGTARLARSLSCHAGRLANRRYRWMRGRQPDRNRPAKDSSLDVSKVVTSDYFHLFSFVAGFFFLIPIPSILPLSNRLWCRCWLSFHFRPVTRLPRIEFLLMGINDFETIFVVFPDSKHTGGIAGITAAVT